MLLLYQLREISFSFIEFLVLRLQIIFYSSLFDHFCNCFKYSSSFVTNWKKLADNERESFFDKNIAGIYLLLKYRDECVQGLCNL